MRATYLISGLLAAGILIGSAAIVTYGFFQRQAARQLPSDHAHPVMYVALGDSTVYGVGAGSQASNYVSRVYQRLRSVYSRARLVNLGVNGATAAHVREVQLGCAVALRPDLVTLSIGPNDITQKREVRRYEQDLETILRTLIHETAAVVVVNLIPDLAVTPRFRGKERAGTVGRWVLVFNEALSRQARAYGAELVDLYQASQEEVPRHPELIAADGYHPSDQGYARWAELMWKGVEARIQGYQGRPVLPSDESRRHLESSITSEAAMEKREMPVIRPAECQ
jgi:lysophospholipase L1-like esterase